jgi:sugar-specific transcriptional regulator TrmB
MASNVTQLLERLGLTEYEAKALDAMFKLQEAQAPAISRHAQIPKTRVYDVLDRLVKKEVLIEIFGRPKKYRVVEPSNALSLLLEERSNEIKRLEKESQKVMNELTVSRKDSSSEKVLKVKNESDFVKILAHEVENARKSVVGFTKIGQSLASLKNVLSNAANKNVEVKILNTSVLDESELKTLGITGKNFTHDLNAYVIDKKKLILAINDFKKQSPEYHFTVWHNREMVDLMATYFEKCWKKAR